jgi:hypothetical protein
MAPSGRLAGAHQQIEGLGVGCIRRAVVAPDGVDGPDVSALAGPAHGRSPHSVECTAPLASRTHTGQPHWAHRTPLNESFTGPSDLATALAQQAALDRSLLARLGPGN